MVSINRDETKKNGEMNSCVYVKVGAEKVSFINL